MDKDGLNDVDDGDDDVDGDGVVGDVDDVNVDTSCGITIETFVDDCLRGRVHGRFQSLIENV